MTTDYHLDNDSLRYFLQIAWDYLFVFDQFSEDNRPEIERWIEWILSKRRDPKYDLAQFFFLLGRVYAQHGDSRLPEAVSDQEIEQFNRSNHGSQRADR